MRILVTGAAGTLGRALKPRLDEIGHESVLFDIAPPAGPGAVRGDVRNAADVRAAADGVDIVVHTAAIHGIHLATHTPHDFYELNVTGTFNVWQAAVEARVKGVVFSSTMGVYGESRRPPADDQVAVLREGLPLRPADVYGWAKLVGEEMCALHWREHEIPSTSLRFGMFVPEPFFRYGIRLLYGGVDERDAADSVIAAIDALGKGGIEHEAFNVESLLPFDADDAGALRDDPLAAIERHYPGATALLRGRGVTELKPITEWFAMAHAGERLGFSPQHNFAEWLQELERRPDERAQSNPPWP